MNNLVFLIIVAAFAGILFVNVFFRVKVLKLYKYLVQNEVHFTTVHFFQPAKMEREVLKKYPQHRDQILEFVSLIKRSMTMASLLIAVIIVLGLFLMRNR